jgi:hypothetical protein
MHIAARELVKRQKAQSVFLSSSSPLEPLQTQQREQLGNMGTDYFLLGQHIVTKFEGTSRKIRSSAMRFDLRTIQLANRELQSHRVLTYNEARPCN